jgi:hemerythrin superfamily protein
MSDKDIIDNLKKEIAYLRSELDRLPSVLNVLREAIKFNSDDTTKHIVYIYEFIKTLDDRVAPMEKQIFPNVSEAREQLGLIMAKLSRAREEEADGKKSSPDCG